jgi:hypothetical protein
MPAVCGDDSGSIPNSRTERITSSARPRRGVHSGIVATHRADSTEHQHLELPVEELLRLARPLPPHEDMVIEDIDEEEGAAFLAAVGS